MKFVNRSAVIIKPRQPYIDWANSLDDSGPTASLSECRAEGTVFLVSELEREGDLRAFVKARYRMIFEHELEAWMRDESVWPRNRTYRMFREWFDVAIHDLVFDLGDNELAIELL